MHHLITILLLLTLCVSAQAQHFTAAEQQQISIATPGLFERSKTIQIDFTKAREQEYSFPLPVGKVTSASRDGLTIETRKGDAVKAMWDGTVRLSRHHPTYGNVIVVRHNNGLETFYGGNAQNLADVGKHVKAGQTIAIVGQSGGRHQLQFAIMANGNKITPATIINVGTKKLRRQVVTLSQGGRHVGIKADKTKEQKHAEALRAQTMSLDTNDPFRGRAVYRLNLDLIENAHYPLDDDAHVISGYGGSRRGHSGTDIKNAAGRDVYAAFDGLVVQAGTFAGYGKCITIRHTNGLETRYSHNSKNLVTVGDNVKAGQVIALTGRTGRATTEHVHFETRIAGRPFNSAYIFDHNTHTLNHGILQFKPNGSVAKIKK